MKRKESCASDGIERLLPSGPARRSDARRNERVPPVLLVDGVTCVGADASPILDCLTSRA